MNPTELKTVINNLSARVDLMQQILPTLATRDDLSAVRHDLLTRQDLLATKQELWAVRHEVLQALSHLEERLRSQMLMLHEDARSDNRLLAEHLARLFERVDGLAHLIERRH